MTEEEGRLPVSVELVKGFSMSLRQSGTPAWQRLQAVQAVEAYRDLVLRRGGLHWGKSGRRCSDSPSENARVRTLARHSDIRLTLGVYGKQLFSKLDPAVATDKCPYLKALLDEMLTMAKAAGLGRSD